MQTVIYVFAGIGVAATLIVLGCAFWLFVLDPASTR